MWKMILSFVFMVVLFDHANSYILEGVSASPSSLSKCTSVCAKTFPLSSNKIPKSECCSRGCRFFGIAELIGMRKQIELNASRTACHNCCLESYSDSTDRAACMMGCDTMAKRQLELSGMGSAEDGWSFVIEDGDIPQILQAGELMEPDDILTDPALKRQVILDLVNDNRLPEMRVKTLPVTGENGPGRGKWWSDCSIKSDGVPHCLAASLFMLLIVLALWVFLSCDERSTQPSPPVIFNSDQALPLPPKYCQLDDVKV